MASVRPVLNRYHAAVAATHSAPHGPLDRYLRTTFESGGDVRHSFQHRLWAAAVDHQAGIRKAGSGPRGLELTEFALERNGDAPTLADRSVLGREHEPDASRLEPIHVEQLWSRPCSVKERRFRAAGEERLAKRREWGEADAAGDHPRLGRRINDLEWTPKRTETGDGVSLDGVEQNPGCHTDALAEQRQPFDAVVRAKHFEDGERAPQERIYAAAGFHHDELTGRGGFGDFWSSERDDVVVGGKTRVADHARLDVAKHSAEYSKQSAVGNAGGDSDYLSSHRPLLTAHCCILGQLFNAAQRDREEVNMPDTKSAVVMDADRIARTLTRIAHEIVERNKGVDDLALVGVRTRGVHIARRLARILKQVTGDDIRTGALDITLYRDDLMRHAVGPQPVVRRTEIPFSIDDKKILLVDDVLYTGRTTRAALDALIDFGRPKAIQLIVLVDRGHRELPIKADYVGKNLPTNPEESVQVRLQETDGNDEVVLQQEATV
jgi:pyrimidine operon attenuation protein/uracil phosphoribosyltransferase